MVVGRTCAGTIIAKAVAKPTTSATAAIRSALATPAIHRASPSGIAITATSLTTTPMPITKLRARSLKGQDMGVVFYSLSSPQSGNTDSTATGPATRAWQASRVRELMER